MGAWQEKDGGAGELDALLERTRIEFPEPTTVHRLADLFDYVAHLLAYEVKYIIETAQQIDARVLVAGAKADRETLGVKLKGSIGSYVRQAYFDGVADGEDPTRIAGLTFFTAPGYRLHELPPDELKVLDNVRTAISQYFHG